MKSGASWAHLRQFVAFAAAAAAPTVYAAPRAPRVTKSCTCTDEMVKLCDGARRSSAGNCHVCVGMHQSTLMPAGCTNADLDAWCMGNSPPCAPPGSTGPIACDTQQAMLNALKFMKTICCEQLDAECPKGTYNPNTCRNPECNRAVHDVAKSCLPWLEETVEGQNFQFLKSQLKTAQEVCNYYNPPNKSAPGIVVAMDAHTQHLERGVCGATVTNGPTKSAPDLWRTELQLTAPQNLKLRLDFSTMYLRKYEEFQHSGLDRLYIYDGLDDKKALLTPSGGWTANTVQEDFSVVSSSQTVLLRFDNEIQANPQMAGMPLMYSAKVACVCTSDSDCGEHGVCEDKQCACERGYEGVTCAEDSCNTLPCSVSASNPGWGEDCRTSKAVRNPQAGQGVCGPYGHCRLGECYCAANYTGDRCEIQPHSSAQTDWAAMATNGVYLCTEGYTGNLCQDPPWRFIVSGANFDPTVNGCYRAMNAAEYHTYHGELSPGKEIFVNQQNSSIFIQWRGDGWIMYYQDLKADEDVTGWRDKRGLTCADYAAQGLCCTRANGPNCNRQFARKGIDSDDACRHTCAVALSCANMDCGQHGKCTLKSGSLGNKLAECACEAGWVGEQCEVQYAPMPPAFTVTGATEPDNNGVYRVTAEKCGQMPVYRNGKEDSRMLFQPMGFTSRWNHWEIGDGMDEKTCKNNGYVKSSDPDVDENGGDCRDSPDGEGCLGKWSEYLPNQCQEPGGWCPNPNIVVVADHSTNGPVIHGGSWVAECTEHTDCAYGSYCDDAQVCTACWLPDTTSSCNAVDGTCCSDEFLATCTNNPFSCTAKYQLFFYNPSNANQPPVSGWLNDGQGGDPRKFHVDVQPPRSDGSVGSLNHHPSISYDVATCSLPPPSPPPAG